MTTICYSHKEKTIAWDSRSTRDGLLSTDRAVKMKDVNGVKFWLTGPTSDFKKFIDMYFGEKCGEFYPECYGFAYDGELIRCGVTKEGEFWREEVDINSAVGSGANFALSAMLLGLSASQAVEHAMLLDVYTGGKVNTFKVGE